MASLSPTLVLVHDKHYNNSQQKFYIHYYLLLVFPIIPFHNLHTTLLNLLEAHYGRHSYLFSVADVHRSKRVRNMCLKEPLTH